MTLTGIVGALFAVTTVIIRVALAFRVLSSEDVTAFVGQTSGDELASVVGTLIVITACLIAWLMEAFPAGTTGVRCAIGTVVALFLLSGLTTTVGASITNRTRIAIFAEGFILGDEIAFPRLRVASRRIALVVGTKSRLEMSADSILADALLATISCITTCLTLHSWNAFPLFAPGAISTALLALADPCVAEAARSAGAVIAVQTLPLSADSVETLRVPRHEPAGTFVRGRGAVEISTDTTWSHAVGIAIAAILSLGPVEHAGSASANKAVPTTIFAFLFRVRGIRANAVLTCRLPADSCTENRSTICIGKAAVTDRNCLAFSVTIALGVRARSGNRRLTRGPLGARDR